MAKQRIFISFDYDIKIMLAGQAKHEDSPFDFADGSIKEHLTGDWLEKARARIGNCDQVIVLCGDYTHLATGVAAELEIAQSLAKPYFLLNCRSYKLGNKPTSAKQTDKIYNWTWENLKALIGGAR